MGLDQMGNMFARREGTDPDSLPVYVGSHLDTQPTGGKYDGVLGVLGGLEILRTLNDLGIHTQDWVYERTDADGKTFGDELARIGWRD